MRRGFTLVETLLSFSILSLVVVLLLNLFPTAMTAIRTAEQRYRAQTMASDLLERQASRPFAELIVGPPVALEKAIYDEVEYRPSLEVFNPESDPQNLKGVRVTVRWTIHDEERSEIHELYLHHLSYQQ